MGRGKLCWLMLLLACASACLDGFGSSSAAGAGGAGGGGGSGGAADGGAGGGGSGGGGSGGTPALVIGAPDPGGAARSVAAVVALSLVVRESNALVAFGLDERGWFGPAMSVGDPPLPPTIVALDVAQLSAADFGLAWLDGAGRAWFFGTSPTSLASGCPQAERPVACLLGDGPFAAIHLGDTHVLALDADGRVHGAGDGAEGQLGEPRASRGTLAPLDLRAGPDAPPFHERVATVRAISTSSFLLTSEGRQVLRLGAGAKALDGTLAPDDGATSWAVPLPFATDCGELDGPDDAVVARCGARLVGWGGELMGRLGQSLAAPTPVEVAPADGPAAVRLVGATPFATFFEVGVDRELHSIGAATTLCRDLSAEAFPHASLEPGRVFGLPPNDPIVEAVGGHYHTLFRLESGRLFGCGQRTKGALGPRQETEPEVLKIATELLAH